MFHNKMLSGIFRLSRCKEITWKNTAGKIYRNEQSDGKPHGRRTLLG